jgi:predicted enzyme related to lactoylglutathione lyase/phosphohistidine phosphatase SixA
MKNDYLVNSLAWTRTFSRYSRTGSRIAFASVLVNVLCLVFSTSNVLANSPAADTDATFTTIYLVRHAEKQLDSGKDPELTARGKYRAANLAKFFNHIPLDAVYSTDTIRTRSTAASVVKSQSMELQIYDARSIDHAQFAKDNSGKTVLVIGHSNTIPAFVNALIGQKQYEDLDESEYDDLFVVNIVGEQRSAKRQLVILDKNLGNSSHQNIKPEGKAKASSNETTGDDKVSNHEKIDYLEYAAKDIDATKSFFTAAFGWAFVDYGPDYASFENQGVNGGFYRADLSSSSTNGGALTVFYSDKLEDTEKKVTAAGGVIIKPIFSFPGGRRFHFTEPSGNEFAVWGQ